MNKIKKTDVLVEDYIDERSCKVWADPGLKELIQSIVGVTNVYQHHCDTQYEVFLDPRYDRKMLIQEIIALIKCRPE